MPDTSKPITYSRARLCTRLSWQRNRLTRTEIRDVVDGAIESPAFKDSVADCIRSHPALGCARNTVREINEFVDLNRRKLNKLSSAVSRLGEDEDEDEDLVAVGEGLYVDRSKIAENGEGSA